MISFKFRLTEDEYFRYNYYTAWADPRRKRYRVLYFFRVILLYGAVAFLYILASRPRFVWIDISVFVFTGLVYLMFIPFFIKRSVKRKVNDILSKKENEHILNESEIILSEDGIVDKDTLSESRYNWDAIVHLAETPDGFYLYTNSYHAIVIPKRVIQNPDQLKEVESMLQTSLPLHA
jgi:hypothetical protein